MKKAVFAIVKSDRQADQIVQQFQAAGFPNENISVLMRDNRTGSLKDTTTDFTDEATPRGKTKVGLEKHTKAAEGAATGATIGGIIGGTIGLLAGIGTLAIPGLGALVAAGPIMGALSGSAVGGTVGLVTGSLVGLGVPEVEAKVFEGRLKEGGTLVAVHCDTAEEIEQATKICKNNGAENVCTTSEKVGSAPNKKNRTV
ncbi:MAG: hypothetical protein Q8K75_07025 [Chlamydiales bacterium]|nr:hypothetical protein [Chlamydiales bacterium]